MTAVAASLRCGVGPGVDFDVTSPTVGEVDDTLDGTVVPSEG